MYKKAIECNKMPTDYKKALLILALVVFTFAPLIASADADIVIPNPIEHESFEELIGALTDFIFSIALSGVVLGVLVGAFFILTSAGEPKKWQKGQQIILYTIIGLAILLLARGIIGVLQYVLGYKG